jgi:hypothetical protein
MAAHLGCQANNLAPSLHPQVSADHSTYPRAQQLALIVEQHRRVVVEAHPPSVRPSDGFLTSDDDGATHVAAADFEHVGNGLRAWGDGPGALYDADDLVAHGAPTVVDFIFEHVDALDEQCARVVYDLWIR